MIIGQRDDDQEEAEEEVGKEARSTKLQSQVCDSGDGGVLRRRGWLNMTIPEPRGIDAEASSEISHSSICPGLTA